MGNKNKINSREVDSKVIDLNSSKSAGNRTVAIHFSTEHNNQFCRFQRNRGNAQCSVSARGARGARAAL